jgi:cob(I)alamin adenosyltransferase
MKKEANSINGRAMSYLKGEFFQRKELIENMYHKIQTNIFHMGIVHTTRKGS